MYTLDIVVVYGVTYYHCLLFDYVLIVLDKNKGASSLAIFQ